MNTEKTALGIEFGSTRIKTILLDLVTAPSHLAPSHERTDLKGASGHMNWRMP